MLCLCLMAVTAAAPVKAQHAATSLLGSGDWWKLEINEEGVYKITSTLIPSLGGCNVDDIAVYGSQGGMLSMVNGTRRPDDLDEVPVDVHDLNGNGTFDDGDYLLVYATSPGYWHYNSTYGCYQYRPHLYSRSNYLFLSIQQGSHKRIATVSQSSGSGDAIVLCHAVTRHEADLVNTHGSGQIWVGENFTPSNNQRTISLQLPSAPSSSLHVHYALAAVTSVSSSFKVALGSNSRTVNLVIGGGKTERHKELYDVMDYASGSLDFNITYNYGESTAIGYLDYIEVDALVPAALHGAMTTLRYNAGSGTVNNYSLGNATTATRLWDVTNYNDIHELPLQLTGSTASFAASDTSDMTLVAFNGSSFLTPVSVAAVANQNIHANAIPELVIVCHRDLLPQAERLANLHRINDDMEVLTVTQEQVYNEFSSGQTDPMAIREMMRMFWLRAQNGDTTTPRYLLLFGKATYDPKDILGNALPTLATYQSPASFDDKGSSFSTDDIYAYLEDGESGENRETQEIGIGRLSAKSIGEATHLVDKIEHYMMRYDLDDTTSRGDWRNSVALLADDADPDCRGDIEFTTSSEVIASRITNLYPQYTIDKIYADAYVQQSGADGSYYPDVNNALNKRINYGCLLLNYIGHGSSQYIGTERFMRKSDIANYTNIDRLPLFITSTCTFGRHDDPTETCGAEEFLLSDGAGIGCIAATRPISHIEAINTEMCMQALDPANRIGDIIRNTNNLRPNGRTMSRCLLLQGDPALRLSYPIHRVAVTSINGIAVDSSRIDSALVLSTVTVEGEIQDLNGEVVTDFDGIIYPEVYDRPRSTRTLANDNDGCEVPFTQQNNLLYKGQTTVSGGHFSYSFIVPRDVSYKFDYAKLCHYAKSSSDDATGAYTNLMLGGYDASTVISDSRPEIRLFMNDTNFRNGGITDANPTLVALLFDSTGINSVGSGLGHDMVATLDGNANAIVILNDFYETDINDPRRGTLRYTFTGLASGRHTLELKAWNIFNYSNSATVDFVVHDGDSATSSTFRAVPNPAVSQTTLSMEHNCSDNIASLVFEIFDIRGRCVRRITTAPVAGSYVAGPVVWDLRGDNGSRVPHGIYIARCTLTTTDGTRLTEHGKVVVR